MKSTVHRLRQKSHQSTPFFGTTPMISSFFAPNIQRRQTLEEETVQMMPLMRTTENGAYQATPRLTSQLSQSKGGGSPLSVHTLNHMNRAFRADFSNVRVHTDSQAQEMSQGIQAKAFTQGPDIYFNLGQYSPESLEGKKLLAHELTHVVQQGEMIHRSVIQRGPTPGTSPSPSANLEGLTNLVFRYGDFSARLSLPRSITLSFPARIRNVGTLTFNVSSTIPDQFALSVALDTTNHIRIAGKMAYNSDTSIGTAGLSISSMRQICTLPNRKATQERLTQLSNKLQTAIQNYDASEPMTAVGLGKAVYNLYHAAQQATRPCTLQPSWSVDLGASIPLQRPEIPPGSNTDRVPPSSIGLGFTWHF